MSSFMFTRYKIFVWWEMVILGDGVVTCTISYVIYQTSMLVYVDYFPFYDSAWYQVFGIPKLKHQTTKQRSHRFKV